MDRRNAERFVLKLRCFLSFPGLDKSFFVGTTENISRVGLLVRCRPGDLITSLPAPGEYVEVDLELPSTPRAERRSLHCQATVVSIRRGKMGENFIALAVNQMQFRDLPMQFRGVEAARFEASGVLM